jgi:hypothetical protein
MLEAVPIGRCRQKLAGNVQPVFAAVAPAATKTAVKHEFTVRVEQSVAYD